MTDDRRNWLCGVAALLLLMVAWDGEAKLNLAFEDRADPNPRQMQIAAEVAGRKAPRDLDFPTITDGIEGMQFIETAVRSARLGARWVKFPC